MAKLDPQILSHLEWLGFVRPTGLVVSAPALVRAGAILDQRDAEGQRRLLACAGDAEGIANRVREPSPRYGSDLHADAHITDFRAFASTVLGWRFSPKGYAGTPECPIPSELELPLPDAGGTLRPDYAVRELEPPNGASSWQLLVRVVPGEGFDEESRGGGRLYLSPHSSMERLLRHTGVPAGLLVNGRALRLVSAPRGESSGWLDFRMADMVQTAGRPIVSALRLLLSEQSLLTRPRHQRLAALLADSRKFQNEVSEKLAEQVLHALYELLRGFQMAHDASKGELLRQVLAEHPDEVYRALLTVILRLVFLLYAEERDMLPEQETFLRYYSLAGLHERLREDAALYPDTMDQRFGAWAQLVALFRMVHDGADATGMHLPPRHGVLFDPDRFPFLEGRTTGNARHVHDGIEPPLVPDGTIYRALEKLLVLDGERISYRALDVEQIGSVYETMMGFRLETAKGPSVAVKAQKKQGAPTVLNLEALLAEAGANRAKWIQTHADRKLTDTVKKAVEAAATLEDLHAALVPVIDQAATPDLVPRGAMVLQPSEERRRSGSHYTPRELTEPIVRTTLDPVLARLREDDGRPPRPEAILDLKVCDPAMGSGAFLVEACRYLADALVEAWRAHDARPAIPLDEDEVVFARRLVVQRCLYGVDRNPVAVDLAKMSLWLATLARDHALTFVDHALRHGDSLVGLSRRQIEAFHWEADAPRFQAGLEAMKAREHLAKVTALRQRIQEAGEAVTDQELRDLWDEAQAELSKVRLLGDLVLAAWFQADNLKERDAKRLEFANAVMSGDAEGFRSWLENRRHASPPLTSFHWEIEFTEAFQRDNGGFDCIVGNPPFLGGIGISAALGEQYRDWLLNQYEGANGNADLSAYFFRRSASILRGRGTLGLVATKTIAQGDTRTTGLRWLLQRDFTIYSATTSTRWPGAASVAFCVIHLLAHAIPTVSKLDGKLVPGISSRLLPATDEVDPQRLASNVGLALFGVTTHGAGFVVNEEEYAELVRSDASNAMALESYIGGSDVNTHPHQSSSRYVINFRDMTLEEAQRWPDLLKIVEERVRPERMRLRDDSAAARSRKARWWLFAGQAHGILEARKRMDRVLVTAQVTKHIAVSFQPSHRTFSKELCVFLYDSYAAFALLQSRLHEEWARLLTSSLGDTLRYSASDCFETLPFPLEWSTNEALMAAGEAYDQYRTQLMNDTNQGITKTYNRFHDPNERDSRMQALRGLHAAIDQAALNAYGWADVQVRSDFYAEESSSAAQDEPGVSYRYRWSDDVQAEVLARLLELNAERARAEARAGAAVGKKGRKKAVQSARRDIDNKDDLFL